MEGIETELLRYAFTGVNIIPTLLLIIMQIYWLVAITGFFDFEFLDFDLEGAESVGPLNALAVLLNIGQVPAVLAISLIILNFWIVSMLLYYLPIVAGGLINGVLLIPAFVVSLYITKVIIQPVNKLFIGKASKDGIDNKVLGKRCVMLCDLDDKRLGQARVKQNGASVVMNVKKIFDEETFKKGEVAFVYKKDEDKDFYYIAKSFMNDEATENMEAY